MNCVVTAGFIMFVKIKAVYELCNNGWFHGLYR